MGKRLCTVLSILLLASALLYAGGEQEDGEPEGAAAETATGTFEEARAFATPAAYEAETGNTISEFKESPMMTAMVESGELPPLEDRLPDEPAVLQPWDSIGKFGGTFYGETLDIACAYAEHLFEIIAPKFDQPVPNVAKGWELADDAMSLEIYLREGLRWSDGEPFTADDFVFWYEDMLLNDDLTPVKPAIYSPGGELMGLEKIDPYTIRLTFSQPYPPIIDVLASDQWWQFPIPPAHYMKQWHPKYNDGAQALAEEEGFENWWEAFQQHLVTNQTQQDVNRPVINAWVLEEIDNAGNMYYRRNPYYWRVDVEGNQLPYIDEMVGVKADDDEVKKLKVISGELNFGGVWQSIADYPLYKDGEEDGQYTAMLWDDPRGAMSTGLTFNQTSKDPVKRQVFSDIRFRQAMSLALNREEINEVIFYGRGIPRQASPPPPPANNFFEEWMADHYADFDVEQANTLLDEMGMEWDSSGEFRLGPDGEPFTVVYEYTQRQNASAPLFKEYWAEVGINVVLKEVARSVYGERREANEVDLCVWSIENTEFTARRTGFSSALPPWTGNCHPWATWIDTDGAQGEEPPDDIKRAVELRDRWVQTVPGTDQYLELGKEIAAIPVRGLHRIGAVGVVPYAVVITNKVGNHPKVAFWSPSYQQWVPYKIQQFYFK